jgi:hypothetical protein
MADTRKSFLQQQLDNIASAVDPAINAAASTIEEKTRNVSDGLSRLVDVGKEKLGIAPPIQNYIPHLENDSLYYINKLNNQQYDPRTVPASLGYGQGTIFHGEMVPGTVTKLGSNTDVPHVKIPTVNGYRPDPTNKYGGGGGVETMPTSFDANDVYSLARDMAAAKDFGVPQLTPTQMASLFLKEGRSDMGSNGPSGNALTSTLTKNGMGFDTASILQHIAEKEATAKRLGIPFEEAWNGTGTNQYGQTGRQYAASVNQGMPAVNNPKNAQLVALLQSGLEAGAKYPLPKKPKN